jgi:hypothetical protein
MTGANQHGLAEKRWQRVIWLFLGLNVGAFAMTFFVPASEVGSGKDGCQPEAAQGLHEPVRRSDVGSHDRGERERETGQAERIERMAARGHAATLPPSLRESIA